MQNLIRANEELFRREPDETYATFEDLFDACARSRENSRDRWAHPTSIGFTPMNGRLGIGLGDDGTFRLNDWSFSQVCSLAGVSKDTLNKLSSETACQALTETMPTGSKPLQALTTDRSGHDIVRAVHGASYTRLYDVELLSMVREFATDFQPPQRADVGAAENDAPRGTGLYRGEQDMFVFLIDPAGWTDIDGQAFAPGFFLWNSEVGRRSVGIQTFWFQAVCRNHIVWDAVEVVEFSRKHTAKVHDAFDEIRRIIERLVARRDERRDGFAKVVSAAMRATLGDSAEDALKQLSHRGIRAALAKRAVEMARESGALTLWSVVDALTRLAGESKFIGDRTEVDTKASALLTLAAA